MKNKILILFFILSFDLSAQNQKITVSGFVTDAKSGEQLIGTNILLYKDSLNFSGTPYRIVASNNFGYYIIPDIPPGEYFLILRNIGYRTFIEKLSLRADSTLFKYNITMHQEDVLLEEIVISGERKEKDILSTIDISPDLLKQIPSLTGEVSLFKSLQLLPGVSALNEFSNGIYIRGGSPDQTLTLVDGVIVYNPSHLGNFSAAFNENAISKIRLIKGGFPSEYGGRLSSVLDIKLRSGTRERETGSLSLGLLNSQLTLEGPIAGNATYMISGRKMYYDLIQNNISKDKAIPRYNFYDFNSKFNMIFSDREAVSLGLLLNKDNVYSPSGSGDINYELSWRNASVNFNWLKITSKYLFLNTVISYINYESKSLLQDVSPGQISADYFSFSKLNDVMVRLAAEYNRYENVLFKTGLELSLHRYNLFYSNTYAGILNENLDLGKDINSVDANAFIQNESRLFNRLNMNLGIRLYHFSGLDYSNLEPRVSFSFDITSNTTLRAAYAAAHQFLHLITRNDITLPTDLWYPSTKNVSPGRSIQYVGGLESYLFNRTISLSLEGYYKELNSLYEFKDSPDISSFEKIEEAFTKGKGEAYGAELFINKYSGNLTGWIGYTLAWTRRKFDDLNTGRVFYPRYDRRHDISLVLMYKISGALSAGISWIYGSGQGISLPTGQYQFPRIGVDDTPVLQFNYSARNAFKLPAYHKMDFTASYKFQWGTKKIETYFTIHNVYNQKNAFAYYMSIDPETGRKGSLKKITLFPFIPNLGINIKF